MCFFLNIQLEQVGSLESYSQREGRIGRRGQSSKVLSLTKSFSGMGNRKDSTPLTRELRFWGIRFHCATTCKRIFLLTYLGDANTLRGAAVAFDGKCCASCLQSSQGATEDLELELAQALHLIIAFDGMEPLDVCIDILCDRKTKRANTVKLYQGLKEVKGIGVARPPGWWFNFLMGPPIDQGYLEVSILFFTYHVVLFRMFLLGFISVVVFSFFLSFVRRV